MRYYVQTEVKTQIGKSINTRSLVYNFKKQTWQAKMTENCTTTNYDLAESIYSTRVLINRNTSILTIIDI